MLGPDPRLLLDAAPDGVFVADAHGRYIYVNPAGCRMTGCGPGEILDPTTFDFTPGSDAIRLQVAGRPSAGEWMLRHKDGHQVPVEISTNALPDGEWLLFVRDISERKRLEQQALESELALSSIFDLLPWAFGSPTAPAPSCAATKPGAGSGEGCATWARKATAPTRAGG